MAWGVPDAVLLPDGRVRIYWVEPSPQGGMATENIVSATSTDIAGTVFARDEGTRTTGGLVDFEVLRAEPGNWLAIMSTSPEDMKNPQRLLVGTSDTDSRGGSTEVVDVSQDEPPRTRRAFQQVTTGSWSTTAKRMFWGIASTSWSKRPFAWVPRRIRRARRKEEEEKEEVLIGAGQPA